MEMSSSEHYKRGAQDKKRRQNVLVDKKRTQDKKRTGGRSEEGLGERWRRMSWKVNGMWGAISEGLVTCISLPRRF